LKNLYHDVDLEGWVKMLYTEQSTEQKPGVHQQMETIYEAEEIQRN